MKIEDYFSFEAIVNDLIRWRIKGKDVGKVLPPRRMWSRAGVKDRKGLSPETVRRQAIWRTIHCVFDGLSGADNLSNMHWAQNLRRLVDEVRAAVFSGNVAFEKPKIFSVPKARVNGIMQYREVASFRRAADRVILSRMTAYVRDVLEPHLSEHCYSFRRDSTVTYQLAVRRLQEWRRAHADGSMFVAECDIKKFFDNIAHDVVRRRWREVGFDPVSEKVLEAYLAVYSSSEVERRGLPQGGSFSTVLANLVLAAADDAVRKVDDGELFYARYCDDVLFAHSDMSVCNDAMSKYAAALEALSLPMHPVKPFTYKPADGKATAYYSIKSKGPFRWAPSLAGEELCAPWVSFLGSQVRYDGETRIRKESVEKHIYSLGHETAKAVCEIETGKAFGDDSKAVAEWFSRFRNRLIAKGVGYVTAKVEKCEHCWAGAFPNVTECKETKMQMRRLDRVRERMLSKVFRMLPEGYKRMKCRFKGRPFSYFAFLEKATKPTNMTCRRQGRRIAGWFALPYSEL